MYPAEQVHVYTFTPCVQVPPYRQGDDAHSFTSLSQRAPTKPATQVHLYKLCLSVETDVESVHVAPFAHGDDEHSLMSASQL